MIRAVKLLLALALTGAALVAHADVLAPDALIRQTADEVLNAVKHDKDLRAGDKKKVLDLVEAKVLPHFDFEKMTRMAVGRPWRTSTAEQQQALVTEFRTLLVRTYTAAFSRYEDQKVEVKPASIDESGIKATVSTLITKPGSQPIAVDYKMEKKQDGWKVYDLAVDGATLIGNYRNQFEEKVQQSGVDGLIKFLADKNREEAAKPAKKADSK